MKQKESSRKSNDLEFGGIPGSFLMVFGLPVAVYYINLACNKVNLLELKKMNIFISLIFNMLFK